MVNKPEWFYILFGCFGSLVTGSMGPAYGLILSKITAVNTIQIHFNIFNFCRMISFSYIGF